MMKRFKDFYLYKTTTGKVQEDVYDDFNCGNNNLTSLKDIGSIEFPKSLKLSESPKKELSYNLNIIIASFAWDLIFNKIKEFGILGRYRLPKSDITFVNYTDKDDTISYVSNSKIIKEFGKIEIDRYSNKGYDKKFTQEMKVGRFFKKIFPDFPDKKIEEMVNKYKALYDINVKNRFKNFKLVKGEDIREWYKTEKMSSKKLKSCMTVANNRISKWLSFITFRIYKDNPDKINLLILTDDNDKLIGRALVWYLDEPKGEVYMDRIYCVDDKIFMLFLEYAKENSWFRLRRHTKMKVFVKKDYGRISINPYMDTFIYFNRKKKYLTNVKSVEDVDDTKWREYTHVPIH